MPYLVRLFGLMLMVSVTVPLAAHAQATHPLLQEAKEMLEAAQPSPHPTGGLSYVYPPPPERDGLARRLHEAAGQEHDPETRLRLHESAIALYTIHNGIAPEPFVEAFVADARAAGDFAREVAAMEEVIRITRDAWREGENALGVYGELEELLRHAPPELAPQYEERLMALQAETAEYVLRYRHHLGDEDAMLDEAIQRFEAYFEQITAMDHDTLGHLWSLAEAYEHGERFDDAAETYWSAYEHTVSLGPSESAWLRRLHAPSSAFKGYLRNALGEDSDEFRDEFRNFLLEHPPDGRTTTHLTRLVGTCMEAGEYEEAIPLLKRWVEVNEDNLLPHFRLGTALMLAGYTEEAEAVFERIRTMAGRENTFVLMAENELYAIRGGQRTGGSWWMSAVDRVADWAVAVETNDTPTQPRVAALPVHAASEPEPAGMSLMLPVVMVTLVLVATILLIVARRIV